jgi:Tfp pilus assembly protein PilF
MQMTDPPPGQVVPAGQRAQTRALAAYELALQELAAGRFAEAEGYIRTAISLRPDGVAYHSTLAQCLRGEGRIEQADGENAIEMRLRMAQLRANGAEEHP